MSTKPASKQELAVMTPLEAASYWQVRQDMQDLTSAERREFEHWLEASEAHRRAYEQTNMMWRDFEASTDADELRSLRVAALVSGPAPMIWPRAAAVAALALAAIGLASLVLQASQQLRSVAPATSGANTVQYATAHNQRSTVTLSDGTLVTMNRDTLLTVDFIEDRRLIHLGRGQAFFDVAKDAQRPFIVAAADRQIRALGTQFDVRLDVGRVEVVLLEGRVSVAPRTPSLLGALASRASSVELKPDQRLVAAVGKHPIVRPSNAVQVTSWRRGWIVFEDETLERAVVELNRYSEHPIMVGDDAVRRLRLSGVFRIGEPERFGAIIQELLPVIVVRGIAGEMILTNKPHADAAALDASIEPQ